MNFTALDIGTQNILLYNYETSSKLFIILLFLGLSMLYIFITSKNFQDTQNPFIALFRVILWTSSCVYMFSFPLLYIFMLYPSYGYTTLVNTLIRLYAIGFVMFTVYLVFNFTVLLPLQLLKVGKLSPEKFKNTLFKGLKLDKIKYK